MKICKANMNNIDLTSQECEVIIDAMKDLLTVEWLDKKTQMIATNIIKKVSPSTLYAEKIIYPDGFISESEQIISEDLKN